MQKDVFLCCLTVSIIHDQVHVCSDLNNFFKMAACKRLSTSQITQPYLKPSVLSRLKSMLQLPIALVMQERKKIMLSPDNVCYHFHPVLLSTFVISL